MEIYPYSALKILLKKIPKYKKGNKNERTKGIAELRRVLKKIQPSLIIDELANEKELREQADLLDAAIAAYIVFLYWQRGEEKCEVIGNEKEGFILIVKPS